MGFCTDRVGNLLTRNLGTPDHGYARFPYVWFSSAKHAMRIRLWHFEVFLRKQFPWAFEKEGPLPRTKPLFLPDGVVEWVPVEEPATTAAEPQCEPEEQDALGRSETILDYVI